MHPTPLFFVCVAAKGVADGTSACVASNGLTAVEKRDSLDAFGCVARKGVSGAGGVLHGILYHLVSSCQENFCPVLGMEEAKNRAAVPASLREIQNPQP